MKISRNSSHWLEKFSHHATEWTGSSPAFALALLGILIWGIIGPIFDYSDTWQLVINTSTTIITFLMVFLIQRSQNKDAQATQLKLNEILAALKGASNRLINVEDLSEEEVHKLHKRYEHLAQRAKIGGDLGATHSIEEEEGEEEKPTETDRALQAD